MGLRKWINIAVKLAPHMMIERGAGAGMTWNHLPLHHGRRCAGSPRCLMRFATRMSYSGRDFEVFGLDDEVASHAIAF